MVFGCLPRSTDVRDIRVGVGRSVVCKMMSNRFHNDYTKINRGKHNATTNDDKLLEQ